MLENHGNLEHVEINDVLEILILFDIWMLWVASGPRGGAMNFHGVPMGPHGALIRPHAASMEPHGGGPMGAHGDPWDP